MIDWRAKRQSLSDNGSPPAVVVPVDGAVELRQTDDAFQIAGFTADAGGIVVNVDLRPGRPKYRKRPAKAVFPLSDASV